MAARLFRIRVALLGAIFRGSFWKGLRSGIGLLLAFALVAAAAWLPSLVVADRVHRATFDILVGGAVLAGAFAVPFFANKRNLSPAQLAQFPTSTGGVAFGMLVTTVVSWPFLVLAVWFISLIAFRPEWRQAGWVLAAALLLGAVLAVTSIRLMSALSKLIAGARYAGALRTAGTVLGVAALPFVVLAASSVFSADGYRTVEEAARIVSWTPFGAPFAAIAFAFGGADADALGRLAVVGGGCLLLLLLWVLVVRRSLQSIDRPLDPGVARRGLGWFERFAARPASVIAARTLTYWGRDPRYRVALFAIPIAPIVMLVAFWVAGADLRALALVPLPVILLLLGWSQHNDVAMDSTAIWEHVASGIRGRADRAGRLAPVMLIGIPLAVIGSSITVAFAGEWRILPAVLGMNLAVLLVASGVSSVFSAAMPYPSTRPGDSPFVQPQWSGSGSGLAQTLSMLVAIVLTVPAVWVSIGAIIDVSFAQNMLALGVGAAYGALILVLGIVLGGWLFDRSGPELIAVTQVFD